MKRIDQLCDAVLTFGRGLHPNLISKVSFTFGHDGSDLPDVGDCWTFEVKLTCEDIIEGKPVIQFEKTWDGVGASSEEAFAPILTAFRASLALRRTALLMESAALDEIETTLSANVNQQSLQALWTSPASPTEPTTPG